MLTAIVVFISSVSVNVKAKLEITIKYYAVALVYRHNTSQLHKTVEDLNLRCWVDFYIDKAWFVAFLYAIWYFHNAEYTIMSLYTV